MARLPYLPYVDKFFAAAKKPTINVVKLLAHSSATIDHWTAIGNAQFTSLALTKKFRELVILLSAAKFGSAYEWTHHVPLSARFGVTDGQRDEIKKAGKTKNYFSDGYWAANPSVFEDEKDRALMQFLEAVIDVGVVDDALWKRTSNTLSDREIVEIISLQGFYYTFARITTVLKVDIDGQEKSQL